MNGTAIATSLDRVDAESSPHSVSFKIIEDDSYWSISQSGMVTTMHNDQPAGDSRLNQNYRLY